MLNDNSLKIHVIFNVAFQRPVPKYRPLFWKVPLSGNFCNKVCYFYRFYAQQPQKRLLANGIKVSNTFLAITGNVSVCRHFL